MLVLDTNFVRELALGTDSGIRLNAKIAASGDAVVIAIVSAEEALRGRMAQVSSARDDAGLNRAYQRLASLIPFLAGFILLPWDEEAAARFRQFRAQGIRIGTMDLRIACIALEHDATLLTRNTRDFAQVPSLRFENWLD